MSDVKHEDKRIINCGVCKECKKYWAKLKGGKKK
jgi:hypothetical protein